MTQEILAQRLWTAAQNDSGLLTRLRSAYRGRFDVRDALWWRANPLAPTPSGRPDPAAELFELKAAVYCMHSVPEPLVEFVDPITLRTVHATETEHRLRQRMREQAQEDAALDAALATADRWADAADVLDALDGPAQASPPAALGRADPADEGLGTENADDSGAGGWRPRGSASQGSVPGGSATTRSLRTQFGLYPGAPRPQRRFALLLVAVGALVGALVAALMVPALVGPADLPEAAAPAADIGSGPGALGAADPQALEQDYLRIFDEPADFADGKAPYLGAEFSHDSIRSVGAAPAGASFGVYVARRGTGQYCIIVQNADHTGTSACAGPGTLARTGLRVNATVRGTVSVGGNPSKAVLLELSVVWAPDGSITTSSHPQGDSCVASPAIC
ncbi:hypothetical protein E3T33_00790 [Cryobacterium sp. TMT1-2-1]|uniref:hypothetical protein n=1 Tax=Cryobacterium sp. TMT1-2-1 TaxID=1259232 RepID=UPI00106D4D0F|nr:hypothetical protein [Cryobacterium sp. TMT1-2-1]TFD49051.1 hypothetical protein E3T33_00790 [Cryobacterium sp. TMT1-2-1]